MGTRPIVITKLENWRFRRAEGLGLLCAIGQGEGFLQLHPYPCLILLLVAIGHRGETQVWSCFLVKLRLEISTFVTSDC